MSDYISKASVCEILADIYPTDGEKIVAVKEVDKAYEAIQQLPYAQQWIPCNWHTGKENLPQECKSVLICMKDSYGYQIGVSYRTDYNRWEGFGRVNVIAWMPLPEPYIAVETEPES